ncbi:MAG: NAD-dependent epimerase/dehydratase family protein [Anaerolineae bacterium]
MQVLVTGGAGFIGSRLVSALVSKGYTVKVLDALVEQVHGAKCRDDINLPKQVQFIHADVRDIESWRLALQDCDVVYHLAAEVGVGQSMYNIVRYVSANTLGTANLLELLANGEYTLKKLIIASSMSIYGEGAYRCIHCGPVEVALRPIAQLQRAQWEPLCPHCEAVLEPVPTSESKPLRPTSVYAISKRDQEELCLTIGRAYNIPVVALRFFNTYGSGQALSNPYTGVAAIFASRLLNQKPPLIFEDGEQQRDFVHVSDIVQGLVLALEKETANYEVFNIGSGIPITIKQVAQALITAIGVDTQPEIVYKFREGDIRHCVADISKAQKLLGFQPMVQFADGIKELVAWVMQQTACDRIEQAHDELSRRGLTK